VEEERGHDPRNYGKISSEHKPLELWRWQRHWRSGPKGD
jgi:hypothetical protein